MPHERYYMDHPLEEGLTLTIEDLEAHHLIHVMRSKELQKVELVNGRGYLAEATITEIKKKSANLHLDRVSFKSSDYPQLILAQAIPRISRLDTIVEKGTELGMSSLWLFPGELSERKELSEAQLDRIHKITIAAMKQCGRLYLPEIKLLPKLSTWEKLNFEMCFFGDVSENAQPLLSELKKNANTLFLVGPESGLTENEERELLKKGFKGVTLHHNILRTDTAPLVALSLIYHYNLIY